MRISAIVPIYKVEAYLDRCVQSIVDQTYKKLEIILVDDGSPDACGEMCDVWAEKDDRIKVVHKENGGLSDARNAGLAVATGSFIGFVDSDDWLEPEFFQKLYDAMITQNAEIAECGVAYVDESGKLLRQRAVAQEPVLDKIEALRRLVLEKGIYQTVWNKLYRREVLEGILFAKGKYHEDDFWTYQVFERIQKLATVQEPLYNYLQRGTSIIGVGYNLKRLDGIEARFQRMNDLQKYEELAVLTRQNLIMDCMWHYQSVARLLTGAEKEKAQQYIRRVIKETPKVPMNQLTLRFRHRIFWAMFNTMPNVTVWIRNVLKIGM